MVGVSYLPSGIVFERLLEVLAGRKIIESGQGHLLMLGSCFYVHVHNDLDHKDPDFWDTVTTQMSEIEKSLIDLGWQQKVKWMGGGVADLYYSYYTYPDLDVLLRVVYMYDTIDYCLLKLSEVGDRDLVW
jgi:hypothetical protein